MKIDIIGKGAFSSALVRLDADDEFVSQSGSMYRASRNVDIDVTTRARGSGGLLGGVKRLMAKESFFLSRYRVTSNPPGEVGLAPTHMGNVVQLDVESHQALLCTGGSYLGSGSDVQIDTQFQGLKGFVSGESISFIRASGSGPLLVGGFGHITCEDVQGELIVDTGHVVAFTEGLQYSASKIGGSWLQSWLAGEGIVLRFSGNGRIWVQSHNPKEFGKRLGPKLPER